MGNKDSGFLKLYRSFFDHFLWNEDREFSKAEAWIDLLRTARYNEGASNKMVNGQVVEWGRGELLASVRFLKNRWNWNSTGKVTRFLDLLEKQNMVSRKTEQGVTVLSICNYCTYNPLEDEDRTATEHEQNNDRTETEHEQVQNSKKVNNGNNGKEPNKSVSTNGTDFPNSCEFLDEARDIANYLLESIIEYDPTHKYANNKPAIDSWVLDIERTMRLDGRTKEQLEFIIDYIYRSNGKHSDFWAGNVESGAKLRKHFDKIKTQIRSESNGRTNKRKQENIESEIQKFG